MRQKDIENVRKFIETQNPVGDPARVREPKEPTSEPSEIDWGDPVSIKAHLDRFIYDQDDAKRALSVAFADYMSLGRPSHTLLIGPSGVGKTSMLEILCDAAGIPFVRKGLQTVSSTGYKGQNLSEVLTHLYGQSKGIIFLDEFDKFYKSFIDNLAGPSGCTDPKELAELLAFLAWHLYRSKPAGIWLDCSDPARVPKEDQIKNAGFFQIS